MSQDPPSALQSLLRLGVMISFVVVSGMAYQVYGPPVDELGGLAEQAKDLADQWLRPQATSNAVTNPAAPSPVAEIKLGELQPMPGHVELLTTTRMAPLTAAPARLPPLRGRGLLNADAMPRDVLPLVQTLKSLGADEFHLASWGAEGALHRFECQAPMPGKAGFARHFDAIEPSAELAVARVCRDVQAWRQQQAMAGLADSGR